MRKNQESRKKNVESIEDWIFVGNVNGNSQFVYKEIPEIENDYSEKLIPFEPAPGISKIEEVDGNQVFTSPKQKLTMVKCSHFLPHGSFYFEAKVVKGNEGKKAGNIRVGIIGERSNREYPIGTDTYSYAYRDRDGYCYTNETDDPPRNFGGESYGTGDVIGCHVFLPQTVTPHPTKQIIEKHIGNSIIINPSDVDTKEKKLNQVVRVLKNEDPSVYFIKKVKRDVELKGSYISFYKNGKLQGIAIKNLIREKYFPAVSIFGGASVAMNFGPKFQYPPKLMTQKTNPPIHPVSNLNNKDLIDYYKNSEEKKNEIVKNNVLKLSEIGEIVDQICEKPKEEEEEEEEEGEDEVLEEKSKPKKEKRTQRRTTKRSIKNKQSSDVDWKEKFRADFLSVGYSRRTRRGKSELEIIMEQIKQLEEGEGKKSEEKKEDIKEESSDGSYSPQDSSEKSSSDEESETKKIGKKRKREDEDDSKSPKKKQKKN